MRLQRWLKLGFVGAAAALFVAGCGHSETTETRVDDAVQATEEALTTVLLGPPPDETSLAPLDKPLLVKGVHDVVYVAADEQGFISISEGSLKLPNMQDIEERVVKGVNETIHRRGFEALRTGYPAPPEVAQHPNALLAVLLPATEETGSPQDRARGRSRKLVLIRMIISDAATGKVLSERDYYSGVDVHRNPDGKATPILYRQII